MTKTYNDVIQLKTFQERLQYCALRGHVSELTFGHNRYMNQLLYRNPKWKQFRRDIIIRDHGRDLAVEGYELDENIQIHHLNPITVDDILNQSPSIYDPNNVICTSQTTHNYIHYGLPNTEVRFMIADRKPNDTIPWR